MCWSPKPGLRTRTIVGGAEVQLQGGKLTKEVAQYIAQLFYLSPSALQRRAL